MILTSASHRKPRESCKGHSANWQGNWLRQACYTLYCAQQYTGKKEEKQSNFPFCYVHTDMLLSVRTVWVLAKGELILAKWIFDISSADFFSNIMSGNEMQSYMTFTSLSI